MKKLLSILACAVVIGFSAVSSTAWAQAKSAKACTDEWRADKAGFQAKGITEKAYVAGCRAGNASGPSANPAPAPKAALPRPMAPSPATANQKTAKDCTQEWRADKAGFRASGITEKAYVADCRSGKASAPAAAPAPTTAAPAPSIAPSGPAAPRPTAASPTQAPAAPTARTAPTGSPAGAKQFAIEAQATATCPGDTVVWVNLPSKIYHFKGTHNYGTTKNGAYMCEKDTAAQGMRAAKNEQHP
jgi:hypothetical protein